MNKVVFHRTVLAAAITASSLSMSGCGLTDNDGAYVPDDNDLALFAIANNVSSNGVCPEGGREIVAGLDRNLNGVLEADEISDTVQICSGSVVDATKSGLLKVTPLDSGNERCASGGFLVEAMRDDNVEKSFDVCNATPDNSQPDNTTEVSGVSTGSAEVSVPGEFDVPEQQPTGDFDGAMMFAGSGESAPEAIPMAVSASSESARTGRKAVASHSMQAAEAAPSAVTTREVASFVADRPVLSAGTNAGEVLQNFANQINSAVNGLNVANVSTGQLFEGIIYNGIYTLTASDGAKPTQVANELVKLLGVNKLGGEVTGLPESLASESIETEFRLFMTVVYLDQDTPESDDDRLVLVASVTPTPLLNKWENAISRLNSGRNVSAPGVTRTPGEKSFTVEGGSNLADFLFVIDNSGSMSGDQQSLSEAADSFINVMQSSGLDFQIGTINTGSTIELADTNGDGAFTNDLQEFRDDVVNQGTSGSGTETGIYNAEQALQSTALGDAADGVVTAEGHPRSGASLSVVILSDEPSQYTRRSGGVEFDPQINLFTERNYTVYSLIEESDASSSQYDDLALATGGSFGDIGGTEDFSAFMEEISKNAGGVSSSFELPENVDPVSIEVRKNSQVVPVSQGAENGWVYRPLSNTVLLRGTSTPAGGDVITIRYDVIN
ncbi:vWA domain-containing protein [Marinobacter sp.]|uniref:vWA domain-containing protein n=1 Tax=Marinobacter sp. TaxID=50741 RepID=UPI002B26FC20|nr:vWA domain-containing protein [Marinobacter sp.]